MDTVVKVLAGKRTVLRFQGCVGAEALGVFLIGGSWRRRIWQRCCREESIVIKRYCVTEAIIVTVSPKKRLCVFVWVPWGQMQPLKMGQPEVLARLQAKA